jgi:hypothetical protein
MRFFFVKKKKLSFINIGMTGSDATTWREMERFTGSLHPRCS